MADPGMFQELPPELQVEATELARRKAVTDRLMRSILGPHIFGGRIANEANTERGILSRYNEGLQQALQNYESVRGGTRGTVPDSGMGFEEIGGTPGDPRKAMIEAMMSRYPGVQRLGGADWKQYQDLRKPRELKPGDLLTFPGGELPNVQAPFHSKKSVPEDWMARAGLDKAGSNIKLGQVPGQYWIQGPNGPDLYQANFEEGQYTGSTKLDNAPTVNINQLPENKAAGTAATEASKLMFEDLKGTKAKAIAATDDIEVLKRAIPVYNAGIKTGSFQMARNEIDKFLETIGIKSADSRISNTDVFTREMAKRVVALLQSRALGAGTGISDADRKFMEMVASGTSLNDEGLRKFFEISMDSNILALNRFRQHLELVSKIEGVPAGFAEAYNIPTPDFGPEGLTIGGPPKAADFGGKKK